MKRFPALLCLVFAAVGCSDVAPIPRVDLSVQVRAPADPVELGRAFPLTVVRVWREDLAPEEWSDEALEPLVAQLLETTRRGDGRHVEETRRYDAHAFALENVALTGVRIAATPGAGGAAQVAESDPLVLRVTRALDAESPGAPEIPRGPLGEPVPWFLWPLALAAALSLIALRLRATRRTLRPVEHVPPPPRVRPELRALTRLADLRAEDPLGAAAVLAWHVEAASLLRQYVGERFALVEAHLSTEELVTRPASVRTLDTDCRDVLLRNLHQCDLVKFARRLPSATGRGRLLDDAEAFVRATCTTEGAA